MAGITGEDFLPYVQEQIKVRQKVLGKSDKSSQDIVWENGKTSWVRLISSVNIDGQEIPGYNKETNEDFIEFYFGGALFRQQYLELIPEDYSGNKLASELPLSGGTPLNNQHRFGITDSTSTLPGIQNSQGKGGAAYGLGGTEFGIKPMPGITGFSSKTYDNGSVRKAEVKIVAHNKKQFEYLESLYIRVGYTMLLEWGNSSYPKSIENGITTYSSTSDIASLSLKDDFLEGSGKGVDHFYTKISNNRKISKGNYDGFLGRVDNFSWEFDKNGNYNITISMITIGSVIENLSLTNNLEEVQQGNSLNPDKTQSTALNTYLSEIDFYKKSPTAPAIQATIAEQTRGAITVIDSNYIQSLDPRLNSTDSSDTTNLDLSGFGEFFVPESIEDDDQQVIDNLPKSIEEEPLSLSPPPQTVGNGPTYKGYLDKDSQKILGGYKGTKNVGCRIAFGENSKTTRTYVRLGELLNYINEKLLIYDIENRPLISIDLDQDLYCYSNGYQFPSDPSKVIFSFQASLNSTGTSNDVDILPDLPKFHDNVNGVKVGRVMNLYYSTDYIREIIKLNTDEGKLKLLPFIEKLVGSIDSLLGGVNKLRVRITDKTFISAATQSFEAVGEAQRNISSGEVGEFVETDALAISDSIFQTATVTANKVTEPIVKQVIQIYDEVQPYEKKKLLKSSTDDSILNIYGFSQNFTEGSFVTDYSFTTALTNDIATEIVIGASAAGRSNNVDATIFSKWNEGLVDRILPKKLDVDQVKKEGENSRIEFKNLTTEYLNFLKQLQRTNITEIGIGNDNSIILDRIYTLSDVYIQAPQTDSAINSSPLFPSSFSNIQRSFFTKALSWLALTEKTPTPFMGFLPVNLSVTLDGLSGIKIFSKLTVNSEFLPSNYGETLEFIITELDHKFENNKWFTTIGTVAIAKLFADTDPSVVFNIGKLIEESIEDFDRRNNSINVESYFYSDQSIVTGGSSGKVTIDQITEALNSSPEVQNKFKGFLSGVLETLGNGFEIRVNSSYRNFRDANRVYSRTLVPENRLGKALRSPHMYGLALDIALYEPIPGQPGLSTNLIAGKPKEFFERWQDLGIVDLANDIGLRWGGVFKQAIREPGTGKVIGTKPFYDCVHFDACPSNWVSEASILQSGIKSFFPNIPLVMTYGYKTNFRDFGIGTEIYDSISLKDYLIVENGTLSPSVPIIIKQGSNAKNVLYKSILIDGNLKYSSGGKTIDLFNKLTNSIG